MFLQRLEITDQFQRLFRGWHVHGLDNGLLAAERRTAADDLCQALLFGLKIALDDSSLVIDYRKDRFATHSWGKQWSSSAERAHEELGAQTFLKRS